MITSAEAATTNPGKRHRVLFFAYHYPPENSIGGARPFRFAKYLKELGYECHVITAACNTARPDLNSAYVPDPFTETPGQGIGFQIERAVRKLLLPGAIGTQWAGRAYQAALQYVEQHRDDAITIFSTFPPFGVHLAAYLLHRKTGLPWIADFRDPLPHAPHIKVLGAHTRALYLQIEKIIVRNASALLANTDSSEEILRQTYPHASPRIHLMWNGFDAEQRISPLPVPERAHRLFTHTGELYGGRTVVPILSSLQRLHQAAALRPGSVHISLIGPLEPDSLPNPVFVENAQAAGWLSVTPHLVPKAEAQRVSQTSDGLLIVQPQSAVQVPGKLFEYLQIGRPILAFVPPDSAIERLLARSGVPYRCLYPAMSPQQFDRTLLEYFALSSDPTPPAPWFEQTFNARNQTASLAQIISALPRR